MKKDSHHLISLLSEENFTSSVSEGVTLVDFYADWCGPCRMLAPVLEQTAVALEGKAKIAKVDIDSDQKIASQFQISSVPTLILFKNGKEVDRIVGLKSASALQSFILSHA